MALADYSVFRLGRYASSSDKTAIVSSLPNTHFMHAYFESSATSGDNRGFYLRNKFSGAAGGGEALRAYSIANAAVGTMHGAHVTGEIGAAGSVTGLIAGLRATLGVATGLTLAGTGTVCALQVDSDMASVVTNMAAAAFVRFIDNGAQKMPHLFEITQTATTDGSTMYWYNGSGETFTCKGGLKIMTPAGALYIPIGTVT